MSSVLFLLLALGLSALGTAVLVWRNRQPNRIETGINEFHREMRAWLPSRDGSWGRDKCRRGVGSVAHRGRPRLPSRGSRRWLATSPSTSARPTPSSTRKAGASS